MLALSLVGARHLLIAQWKPLCARPLRTLHIAIVLDSRVWQSGLDLVDERTMYSKAIVLMYCIINCLGTDPLGDGWGGHCSSPGWSEAWQTFYPYIFCGHCSCVGAII